MSTGSAGKRLMPAAFAVASLLVVVLAIQHRRLEDANRRLTERLTTLPVGSFVPTVRAASSGGDSATIAEPGRTEILLYLTTTCPYCAASVPAWRRVVAHATELGMRVVVLSTDSAAAIRPYLETHGLATLASAQFGDARRRFLYRFSSVPQTLVIDTGGRVVYSRPELFSDLAADSLIDLISGMTPLRAVSVEP